MNHGVVVVHQVRDGVQADVGGGDEQAANDHGEQQGDGADPVVAVTIKCSAESGDDQEVGSKNPWNCMTHCVVDTVCRGAMSSNTIHEKAPRCVVSQSPYDALSSAADARRGTGIAVQTSPTAAAPPVCMRYTEGHDWQRRWVQRSYTRIRESRPTCGLAHHEWRANHHCSFKLITFRRVHGAAPLCFEPRSPSS